MRVTAKDWLVRVTLRMWASAKMSVWRGLIQNPGNINRVAKTLSAVKGMVEPTNDFGSGAMASGI